MDRPELSFCIPVMNRFDDIKATLQKNLEDNRSSAGRVEFILYCFDADNLVESWIKSNFKDDLYSGFLRFYRSANLDMWHFGRAKNAFKSLMKGRIYASLDGDNYTGFKGGEHIIDVFKEHNHNCIFHQFQGDWGDGTCGRISLTRADYIEIGYDEHFLPRQWDELDTILSILAKYPERKYICYNGKSIIKKSFPFNHYITENGIYPKVFEIDHKLDPLFERIGTEAVGKHESNYVEMDYSLKYSSIYNHLCSFLKNTAKDFLYKEYVNELVNVQRKMVEKIDPIILEKWLLRLQGNKVPKIFKGEIVLVSCIKDEPQLIKWYKYYKDLGVTKFILVDDYSKKPIRMNLPYSDVYVWKPISGHFKHAKVFWLEILLCLYCQDTWCLTVDSDEYISLPDFPAKQENSGSNLQRFIDVGQKNGIEYFVGFLFDLIPSFENFENGPLNLDPEAFVNYQYRPATLTRSYKKSNTTLWSYGDNLSWAYQVDIRYRLNRAYDSLRKFPLFYYKPGIHLNQGFHDLIIENHKRNPSELNRSDLIPIQHYKLNGLYVQKYRGLKRDPEAYHIETRDNLIRLYDCIESSLRVAMFSPFSWPYKGYHLVPLPNIRKIRIMTGNSETVPSDGECVDRSSHKFIFIQTPCDPIIKGCYLYGRSLFDTVGWLTRNTPFRSIESLNTKNAVLSTEF